MSATSARRRPEPPEGVRAVADAYRCGNCTVAKMLLHDGTAWWLAVEHDPTCPEALELVGGHRQVDEPIAGPGMSR